MWHHLGSDHDLPVGDRVDDLLLLFELVAVMLPVTQDPELARRAAVGLTDLDKLVQAIAR